MEEINKHIDSKTKVYSLKHGVGEIIGVFNLYDGVDDYLEVRFVDALSKAKVVRMKIRSDLRVISKPIELTYVLKSLNSKILETNPSISPYSFQRYGADMDLDRLIETIASLAGRIDLNSFDTKLLSQCIQSLILEVSDVYKITPERAEIIVNDHMTAA